MTVASGLEAAPPTHPSAPFQPSLPGFSPASLTQQRGDKPERKDVHGDVWELQDLTDGAVQLVGTEGWQVLCSQGHHRVIRQIHQHVRCCNGSQAGSAGLVRRHFCQEPSTPTGAAAPTLHPWGTLERGRAPAPLGTPERVLSGLIQDPHSTQKPSTSAPGTGLVALQPPKVQIRAGTAPCTLPSKPQGHFCASSLKEHIPLVGTEADRLSPW